MIVKNNTNDIISNRKSRCLAYIKIYIETKDTSTSRLRGFLHDWYGFYVGGPLLTKTNNVRWLNNPKHKNETVKKCLEGMDFISVDARAVLNGSFEDRLIMEHAVPVKVISSLLLSLGETCSSPTEMQIEELLCKYYKLGVLTKDEDRKVDSFSLKSTMPTDWDYQNMFARYDFAGIIRS